MNSSYVPGPIVHWIDLWPEEYIKLIPDVQKEIEAGARGGCCDLPKTATYSEASGLPARVRFLEEFVQTLRSSEDANNQVPSTIKYPNASLGHAQDRVGFLDGDGERAFVRTSAEKRREETRGQQDVARDKPLLNFVESEDVSGHRRHLLSCEPVSKFCC